MTSECGILRPLKECKYRPRRNQESKSFIKKRSIKRITERMNLQRKIDRNRELTIEEAHRTGHAYVFHNNRLPAEQKSFVLTMFTYCVLLILFSRKAAMVNFKTGLCGITVEMQSVWGKGCTYKIDTYLKNLCRVIVMFYPNDLRSLGSTVEGYPRTTA